MEQKNLSRAAILGCSATQLSYEDAKKEGCLLVDVRSASEYHSGTIPAAVNVPLFDENERSVIGTIYNHAGKDQAIEQGFLYVETKLRELLGGFEKQGNCCFAVFCARGGMRSRSVVNLLNQAGYQAVQVEGGYKKFRTEVLQAVDNFSPPLIVIHGLTGTGKTRILQQLDNVIDLEDLAQHRSSLFGALDLNPRNQRDFEALLAEKINSAGEPPFFVEGESRKIGRVFIPKAFALAMKAGRLVNVTASVETRVARIIEDYPVNTPEQQVEVINILRSLTRHLGRGKVESMCDYLTEGNLPDLVRILLLDYYDKRYTRSMNDYIFDMELSSENIENCAKKLTEFRASLL